MAIRPNTGELFNGFTFDGVDSKMYGVYITQEAAFDAAERDVEMISIAGRNGEYALDRGRFLNVTVTYKAGITATDEASFASAIRDFRNQLASRRGYCRLEDDYNADEYRLAVYRSGLEVNASDILKAGEFTITFDCKPQRFLKSGEIPRTIGGSVTNPQTKSGTVVSLESDGVDKATSLIATIEAVQAGSGDPSPTNVRAITGWTQAKVFNTGKNLADESTAIGFNAAVTVDGGYISVTKNGSSNYPAAHIDTYLRAGVTYTVSATCVQATAQAKLAIRDIAPSNTTVASMTGYFTDGQRKSVTYTPTKSGMYRVALFSCFGTADTGTAIFTDIQLELGATATAYEPYTGTTTTTALGRTVYGGTVDVVTGTLTLTHKAEIFDGTESWGREASGTFYVNLNNASKMVGRKSGGLGSEMLCNWLKPTNTGTDNIVWVGSSGSYLNAKCSSASDAAAFKSMMTATPLVVVYPLETPQTYNLTTHEVELLAGQNNVWADTGDISITYGHDPNKLVNPTLFDSHPLLEVDGYGTISISGEEVVLHNEPLGIVLLGGGGSYKNSLTYHFDQTQFNTGDFITVPDYRRTYQFDMVKPYGSGEITDFQMTSKTAADYIFSATKYQGTLTLLTDASVFTVGTARTDTYNVVGQFFFNDRSGIVSIYDVELTTSVIYDGTGAIRFRASVSYAENNDMKISSIAGNAPNFYGDSTWQPVTDTAYIDLDIGEAYVIQSGDIIGINNVVDLPAELPTLKAGANTITYDNTITQLEIVPRWWRV